MQDAIEMRPKKPDIVTKNRTLSHAPPGHLGTPLCGDILCWAEARSRELPPGHAYRPHFEVGRHGNMATPRLQRVAPGDLHTWSTLSSQGQLSKGSEAILAFIGEQSSHYHSFWGKLIRGQKTYKAKNSALRVNRPQLRPAPSATWFMHIGVPSPGGIEHIGRKKAAGVIH